MRKDMNFFSQFEGRRKGQSGSDIYVYLCAGIVLVLMIGTALYNSISIWAINSKIEHYENELNKPEVLADILESDKVNVKIDSLTKYDKDLSIIIDEVGSRDAVTPELMTKLYSANVEGLKFGNMNINSKEITFVATATNKVEIAEFQQNLSKIDQVQSVHISSIAGVEADYLTFDVKCVLKEVE